MANHCVLIVSDIDGRHNKPCPTTSAQSFQFALLSIGRGKQAYVGLILRERQSGTTLWRFVRDAPSLPVRSPGRLSHCRAGPHGVIRAAWKMPPATARRARDPPAWSDDG